ncbi:Uu.00g041960.m01.CDS01 [Anthostomella pinea]|uniref:Uu.00g041960.m01.CDS01 n=1 Tax=Anthostomella pinea TaxID=933095 RepID=A0AAI8VAL8_9PEZI|nr:Uu.00g041960.m01.CDS01 [Anthostomella pinea]
MAPAAVVAATSENITISDFVYHKNNGFPQVEFNLSVNGVSCYAEKYTVPGEGYGCSVPEFTFDILEEQGPDLRLYHEVDGATLAGDFHILMNGPVPTILDQVGTSSSVLTPVGEGQ